MDVPAGFTPFENQGPYLDYVGPIHVRDDGGALVLGLRAEDRHANHRGTVQGGLLSTFARGPRRRHAGLRRLLADRRGPRGRPGTRGVDRRRVNTLP